LGAQSSRLILTAFDNHPMPSTHHLPAAGPTQQRWDIFCRVIDNFGDVGVCWRLAADLAQRGLQLRLFIDDASALAWMAPLGQPQVQVLPWPTDGPESLPSGAADVVIEAFGCDPPSTYVQAMAERPGATPVWINLEYLSAEAYVERSHGLPSPQPCGLSKWFFYPGFTPRTGGLLREPDLPLRRAAFKRSRWLQQQGIALQREERLVSLFCYPNPQLPALLQALAEQPTCLLLTPGAAQAAAHQKVPGLRVHRLPWQTQGAYDELLWACDLNFVRGEDSLVRALWARVPLVWQAYPQHDGAQHAKVQALLQQWQPSPDVATLWRWWNGASATTEALPPPALQALNNLAAWQPELTAWAQRLQQQNPLAEQLMTFAQAKGGFPTPTSAAHGASA
jgi:uncharacterized repeat protein (TIGR03837 family)